MTFDMDIETFNDQDAVGRPDETGRPDRVTPLVWVGLALVAVLAGYVVIGHGPIRPDTPDPGPVPSRSAVPVAGPNQRQYLSVTTICPPVTDGRRTLSVSFEVSNVSDDPVQVTAVDGVLPNGGLHRHGQATRGGSCRRPGTEPLEDLIPAGQSRFYTVVLALPKKCPAGYPIQVRLDFDAAGFAETALSLLYSDLSVPDFDACR